MSEHALDPQLSGSLRGKRAVITGGLSGIGLEVARFFRRAGAGVALIDKQPPSNRQPAAQDLGPHVQIIAADVADADQIAKAIDAAQAALGGIDIVVTAAGIARAGTVTESSLADINAVLDVNLKGTLLTCRASIPYLSQNAAGAIVTIASEQGIVGVPAMAAYSASKGGVVQLTRSLAVDHAKQGIRVNCVCPGPVMTPMLQAFLASADAATDQLEAEAATTLLRRIGKPQEIAAAVLFLASESASYITGAILPVDGGATAH